MKVIDFVKQIEEATDQLVNIVVNETEVYNIETGLIFTAKLYMECNITRLEYKGGILYVCAYLDKTPVSEAILYGSYFADGRILAHDGTLYFVDGFEIKTLFGRGELQEVLAL